jgi:Predicted dioxygenase
MEMKRFLILFLLSSLFCFSDYRKPSFSGSFYPSGKEELKSMIDKFLKNVNYKEKIEKEKIIGVIAPHAGYIYSGPIAGYSFKLLEGLDIKTVIIIGRSHNEYFKGGIIDDREGWETPFGKVEIDKEIFEKLYKKENFSVNKVLLDMNIPLKLKSLFCRLFLRISKFFPFYLVIHQKKI